MSVLLVEDEHAIRRIVRLQLQNQGIDVTVAGTVAEAAEALTARTFTVVILDLSLRDGSGLDVLDRLHASGSTSHVIILSGSTAEADRIRAFERGADDFVVKPFYLSELTARVLAVRRRRDPVADATLQIGPFEIDLLSRGVTASGKEVELTAKEFDLLAFLAVRPGHVFDREQLLNAVWRSASEWQQAATVTEHIRRLRRKLEVDPNHPKLLTTVRGAGYRLDLPIAETDGNDRVGSTAPTPDPGELVHVDGLIVFCDEAAADLVGAPDPDEVVGTRLMDLVVPTSLPAARHRLEETGLGPSRRSELMEFRHGDAGEVAVAVQSTPTDWHGQPARRLRITPVVDERARLRRLVIGVLGDVSDAVIATDLHYHIRSWNSAAERLYGWSEEEVSGRHILDVLRWVGGGEQLAEMWERLENAGRWHGESTQLARDGSVVEILSTMTLVRDEAGEPVGIVSVNRAVIEARRARSLALDATIATQLRHALANDEFQVHYQPIVDLSDGRIVSFEALVRWQHPQRGTLLPAEFLNTAERSGLIVELGEVVLDKACRQAAEWTRSGAAIRLSVNVSTRQLADPGMVERFTGILRDAGLDPAALWLEVTETAVVEELEKASHVLRRLVDLGVRVAIDDFGTGWASLTYLRSFPVHALKIDGSFIVGAGRRANDTAIVRSLLALGAELDLSVVAEGIETRAQHDALKRLGCSFGQGYLFGRPVPAGDVPIDRVPRVSDAAWDADAGSALPVLAPMAPTGGKHPASSGVTSRDLAPSPHQRMKPAQYSIGQQPPAALMGDDVESDVVANLLRGLLRVHSAPAAAELLQTTIRGMGGCPVPAGEAGEHSLPVDVSLGEGPPMLVEVERFTGARLRLERLLPRLVEDARQAVDLLRQTERLAAEIARDELTGLANRRVLDRVLPRATSGSVVMIDLDHFKDVNDRFGHAEGDAVLVAFADVLTTQVRAQDTSCRIGGEEFALVLNDADVDGAIELLARIRSGWSAVAPRAVTFSAGVAAVDADGGTAALLAADRALYSAKALGRDRVEVETPHGRREGS